MKEAFLSYYLNASEFIRAYLNFNSVCKVKQYFRISRTRHMDIKKIRAMFAEMGLATQEQRVKYAEELRVDKDNSQDLGIETKVCNNTISNLERYA